MPSTEHRVEVERQVKDMLRRSPGFQAMSTEEKRDIYRNTVDVVHAMADLRAQQAEGSATDPYAVGMIGEGLPSLPGAGGITNQSQTGGYQYDPSKFTGGVGKQGAQQVKDGEFGTGIKTGVNQAGEMLRQINFPAFVTELVQGVFQSIVDASIKQMKAYGELVQSVTMSLGQFRDTNTTDNQARDHLVQKYPNLMQLNIGSEGPRVGPRNFDGEMPSFGEMGIHEKVSSLDEDFIEQKLVPAARNELARSRQQLLATMVLMGINRIVVTDGKINAKLKFDFTAQDRQTVRAQTFDYENFGQQTITQKDWDEGQETGEGGSISRAGPWGAPPPQSGDAKRWTTGSEQSVTTPVIQVTSAEDKTTEANLQAKANLTSEVTINFKSEGIDLNKLVSEGDIFRLEQVRSAGRGAPPSNTQVPSPATGKSAADPARSGGATPPAP